MKELAMSLVDKWLESWSIERECTKKKSFRNVPMSESEKRRNTRVFVDELWTLIQLNDWSAYTLENVELNRRYSTALESRWTSSQRVCRQKFSETMLCCTLDSQWSKWENGTIQRDGLHEEEKYNSNEKTYTPTIRPDIYRQPFMQEAMVISN